MKGLVTEEQARATVAFCDQQRGERDDSPLAMMARTVLALYQRERQLAEGARAYRSALHMGLADKYGEVLDGADAELQALIARVLP